MGARMRALDWSATPLGAVEHWPQSLRTTVGIVLGTRHPMLLFWGPDLVQLYNDASAWAQTGSLGPGLISGHTGDSDIYRRMVPPDAPFLRKPFTPEALVDAVAGLAKVQ